MNNRGAYEARRQREARDRFDSSDDALQQEELRRVLRRGKPGLVESLAKPAMICLLILIGSLGFFTFGPALRSESSQHVKSGISLAEQAQLEEAIVEFDEAIRLDPKLAKAYYHRGNAYRSLEQYELAFQSYNDAVRVNSRFAAAYADRAITHA
ncbi:MAG: tetratricopeptide repeat protein, partial [Dehalococcoidia bacterium]